MAMTPAEKLSCFEILEAFWLTSTETTGEITNGFGIELTLTNLDVLKTNIKNRIDALDASVDLMDVAAVVKIQAIVSEWDSLGISDVQVQNGNVNYDSEDHRNKIRKRLQKYITVMHITDGVRQKEGPQRSAQIPIITG